MGWSTAISFIITSEQTDKGAGEVTGTKVEMVENSSELE